MKAMICQPMNGLTDEQIENVRNKAIEELQNGGYEVVNTFFKDGFDTGCLERNKPVYYLYKSLEMMSQCNVIYFCKGWEYARGCKIEHDVATAYGIPILYER